MKKEEISTLIKKNMDIFFLDIINESNKHKNHLLKDKKNSHFYINVVSDVFINKSMLERHQLVYKILKNELIYDIHALKIKTRTINEFKKKDGY